MLRSTGWRRQPELLVDRPLANEAAVTPERLALQLRTILTETKCCGVPATIVLADEWVRLFMATPPHNTGRLQDCRAAAAMRFQALYGEPGHEWQLEADWDARHPFLACAIPHVLLNALRQVAQDCALQLISVTPHFIAAWNRWHKSLQAGAWFGVVSDNFLTLGLIDQKRLCAVRTTALPADACDDPHWMTAHLAREALRMNLALPTQIQLCGQVPGQWVTQATGALQCTRLETGQNGITHDTLSPEAALAWSAVHR